MVHPITTGSSTSVIPAGSPRRPSISPTRFRRWNASAGWQGGTWRQSAEGCATAIDLLHICRMGVMHRCGCSDCRNGFWPFSFPFLSLLCCCCSLLWLLSHSAPASTRGVRTLCTMMARAMSRWTARCGQRNVGCSAAALLPLPSPPWRCIHSRHRTQCSPVCCDSFLLLSSFSASPSLFLILLSLSLPLPQLLFLLLLCSPLGSPPLLALSSFPPLFPPFCSPPCR